MTIGRTMSRFGRRPPSVGILATPLLNLIAAPNAFDQWTATGLSVTQNVAVNPVSGASDVDRLTNDTSNTTHAVASPTAGAGSIVTGQQYTGAVDLKYETNQFAQLYFMGSVGGTNNVANFDLVNGTVTLAGGGAVASITTLANGFYRCAFYVTATGSGSAQLTIRTIAAGTSARGVVYAGAGTGFLAANAQIVSGTVPNAF